MAHRAAAEGREGGAAGGEEQDVGEAVGDLEGGGVRARLLGGGELQEEHARGGDHRAHAEAAEGPGHRDGPHGHGGDQDARGRRDRERDQDHPEDDEAFPVRLRPRPGLDPGAERPGEAADGQGEPGEGGAQAPLGDQHQGHEGLGGDEGPGGDPAQQDDGGQAAGGPVGAARQQPPHGGHEQRGARGGGQQGRPAQFLPGVLEEPGTGGDAERQPDPAPVPGGGGRLRVGGAGGGAADRGEGEGERQDDEGRYADEDPAPAQVLGDRAGGERADDGGDDPARGEGGHDRGPEVLVVGAADDHVQGDDDEAAAEALHGPAEDERPHGAGGPGEEQPGGEGGHAGGEGRERAVPVGPLAGQDHAEEAGGEVRGEGEGVDGHAVQLAGGDGHGGADGGRLEGDEQDDGDDADAERPVGRVEDGPPVGGLVGTGSGSGARDDGGVGAGVSGFEGAHPPRVRGVDLNDPCRKSGDHSVLGPTTANGVLRECGSRVARPREPLSPPRTAPYGRTSSSQDRVPEWFRDSPAKRVTRVRFPPRSPRPFDGPGPFGPGPSSCAGRGETRCAGGPPGR